MTDEEERKEAEQLIEAIGRLCSEADSGAAITTALVNCLFVHAATCRVRPHDLLALILLRFRDASPVPIATLMLDAVASLHADGVFGLPEDAIAILDARKARGK